MPIFMGMTENVLSLPEIFWRGICRGRRSVWGFQRKKPASERDFRQVHAPLKGRWTQAASAARRPCAAPAQASPPLAGDTAVRLKESYTGLQPV